MATEWYLLKGRNGILFGMGENSGMDFITEDFMDALDSTVSVDVELYNYDLSKRTPIKAIIQNVVQDTKLKSLSRQMLVPIGTCKAGMYVKYKNRFWLIVNIVDDNMMYEKALLSICNYYLTWINRNGEIVQRWANVTSASQYNNGETMTDHYRTGTDQLMILTPDDDECVLLDSGQRFIIDQRCKVYERSFGTGTVSNTSNPLSVYRLTRTDSVLYDYQDSGNYQFMVYQDEQRETDGYYVIDGKGYWLCEDPMDNGNKTNLLTCRIECEAPEIYDGLDAMEFIAEYTDSSGNEVDVDPVWTVDCDFSNDLNIMYVGKSILISVNNSNLVNKSFNLTLSGYGYEPVTISITIKAFL